MLLWQGCRLELGHSPDGMTSNSTSCNKMAGRNRARIWTWYWSHWNKAVLSLVCHYRHWRLPQSLEYSHKMVTSFSSFNIFLCWSSVASTSVQLYDIGQLVTNIQVNVRYDNTYSWIYNMIIPKYSQKTLYTLPLRARYIVLFVSSRSNLLAALSIVMLYVIWHYHTVCEMS